MTVRPTAKVCVRAAEEGGRNYLALAEDALLRRSFLAYAEKSRLEVVAVEVLVPAE